MKLKDIFEAFFPATDSVNVNTIKWALETEGFKGDIQIFCLQ